VNQIIKRNQKFKWIKWAKKPNVQVKSNDEKK
jgi:hypothetical protein